MRKRTVTNCQFCGEEVERVNVHRVATCFTCKMEKRKERCKITSHANYVNKRDKLRAIRSSFERGIDYQNNNPRMSSQRVYVKKCARCGSDMFNVWKTRKYCGTSCNKKYEDKENSSLS